MPPNMKPYIPENVIANLHASRVVKLTVNLSLVRVHDMSRSFVYTLRYNPKTITYLHSDSHNAYITDFPDTDCVFQIRDTVLDGKTIIADQVRLVEFA